MKKLFLTIMFMFVALPVYAYELLMFQMPTCIYCQNFLKEVVPEWDSTQYGKILPLRTIDISGERLEWFDKALSEKRIGGIAGTPTFVVWDGNKEVMRTLGYNGKEQFYEMIHNFIESNEDKFGKLTSNLPKEETKLEGSHNELKKFPNGVYNSLDIMEHQYETEIEAQVAANFLGCRGTHTHDMMGKTIHMPCKMN